MVCRPESISAWVRARRFGDAHLGEIELDRLGHAAVFLALDDMHPGVACQLLGEPLEGVADHELLEDVVLDRAGELHLGHALFLAGDDIESHDRQYGAVHRHRHADLVERDSVEQDAHVEDAVDGDAGHADIAHDAGIVAIVAAVRRQVEGDAQALLAGGQVALVEGVRLLGRREAGVLAHGPRPVDVHRRVWAAHEGREAWEGVEVLDTGAVRRRVEWLDVDPLGGFPAEL